MKGTLHTTRTGPFPALILFALLGSGLLFGGCRPQPTSPGFNASYRLVSVNHQALPAKVNHGASNLEVRQGSFIFSSNGICRSRITFVAPDGREVVRDTEASYSRTGQDFQMKWKGAGRTKGRLEGETFTMDNEGMTFTYQP